MNKADNNANTIKTAAGTQSNEVAKDEPQPAIGLALPIDSPPERHKRSAGLKLFDVALYPLVTNVGVFVISVMATYLTTKGGDKDASGKLIHGEMGKFFQKRGDWLVKKFEGMGMSNHSADMSKMVFFSFADGSLMAPLIKLLEDRREKIGRWCDQKLGTTPDDPDAYAREPKQSWTSVLAGRAGTAAVVVSTAVALNAKVMKDTSGTKISFNDKLFTNPGIKMAEWVKTKPKLASMFGKLDIGELGKVSLFEAFYTSVCTAGLYYSSRSIARGLNKHKEHREHPQPDPRIAPEVHNGVGAVLDTPATAASGFIEEQKQTHSWANEKIQKLTASVPVKPASHLERVDSSKEPAYLGR